MVAEGVPIELIDRTVTAWGFPVGPIALLDEIGLDVAAQGRRDDARGLWRPDEAGDALDRMLTAGRLGRKNGRGFYRYRDGHKSRAPTRRCSGLLGARPVESTSSELIERRLVHAMLNEAAAACSEDVVRSARDGDIGAIYGIGFPAFRGGPLARSTTSARPGSSRRCTSWRTSTATASDPHRRSPRWRARAGATTRHDRSCGCWRSSRCATSSFSSFCGSANPACSMSPAAAAPSRPHPPSSIWACGGWSSPRPTASGW